MKTIINPLLLAVSALLLSACGGGDGGDNFNSSYSKTILKGTKTYVCRSENAANACEKNNDCSACEDKSTNVISQACAVSTATDGLTTYKVNTAGCVLNMANTKQTGVCVTAESKLNLKLYNGTGVTRDEVLAKGVEFGWARLPYKLQNEAIDCVQ